MKQLVSSTIWIKCLDNKLFYFFRSFFLTLDENVSILYVSVISCMLDQKTLQRQKKTGFPIIIFPELSSRQIILFISNLSKVVSVLKSYQLDSTFALSKCCIQIQRLYNRILSKKWIVHNLSIHINHGFGEKKLISYHVCTIYVCLMYT